MRCYTVLAVLVITSFAESQAMDREFEELAARYIDAFPALSPVSATALGDHRFDGRLDEVSKAARARSATFCHDYLAALDEIDRAKLSRANQVDYALLKHQLRAELWRLEQLQEWAWNPLIYTGMCGSAVYNLMAREFAPEDQRLARVADRLEQFPRLYQQIRKTLQPRRVPKIHAETAIKQNRGVISIIENMVLPRLGVLSEEEQERTKSAIKMAMESVEEHQRWLETELLPRAGGDFRLGAELYDKKLAFTLQSSLSRQDIRDRAESELRRVRDEMYEISKGVYKKKYPFTEFPDEATREYKQAIIRDSLEMVYKNMPPRDGLVEAAKESLTASTKFVRDKDLITLPPDPVEIIVMPEFKRGVSLGLL